MEQGIFCKMQVPNRNYLINKIKAAFSVLRLKGFHLSVAQSCHINRLRGVNPTKVNQSLDGQQ